METGLLGQGDVLMTTALCPHRARYRSPGAALRANVEKPVGCEAAGVVGGAAAYDSGPRCNSHAGEVSYSMDPDSDSERDFVRDTPSTTGLVRAHGYVRFTERDGQAGTVADFSAPTDGQVPVITPVHLPKP
ncbi:MAG TPA: hypothetical protein VEI01_03615 [Terriglobales bacterium]|nr:hypothetical protein [Terriglobales bacterium]